MNRKTQRMVAGIIVAVMAVIMVVLPILSHLL